MWISCASVLWEFFWLCVFHINDENLTELLESYPFGVEMPVMDKTPREAPNHTDWKGKHF